MRYRLHGGMVSATPFKPNLATAEVLETYRNVPMTTFRHRVLAQRAIGAAWGRVARLAWEENMSSTTIRSYCARGMRTCFWHPVSGKPTCSHFVLE